ncbi:MAG: hypothetical protein HY721_29305 [Planctomycetes bacterium]|nr:hypothetical protein [Planctomycetota bacterium]
MSPRRTIIPILLLAAAAGLGPTRALRAQALFKRGDADQSGCVNCEDAELIMLHLFGGAEPPACLDALDADDNGIVELQDALLVFRYAAGSAVDAPPPPGPDFCGPDPVPPVDMLDCRAYPSGFCGAAPPDCTPPSAAISGPRTIAWPGGPVLAVYDGRASKGRAGGPAPRFTWAVEGASAAVLRPHDGLTLVRFPALGSYKVKLDVSRAIVDPAIGPSDERCGHAEVGVSVVGGPGVAPSAPAILPVDPALAVALAGRPFRLPVTLSAGSPPPAFSLAAGQGRAATVPAGLAIDSGTGLIAWSPGIPELGQHTVIVRAENDSGSGELELRITVIDPAHPAALYRAPGGVAGGGGGGRGGDGAGGGLEIGDPFTPFPDSSPVEPPLDLDLQPPGAPCAARSVTGGQLPSAVRFDPDCDPEFTGVPSRVYSSASGGAKVNSQVIDRFTIEVWLSNVPDEQLASPGSPAFIFSSSRETQVGIDLNWMLGAEGARAYVAQVDTSAGLVTFRVTAPSFAEDRLHQLAFVREGATHRFYVDGQEAASDSQAGDLSAWDLDLPLHIGNSPGRSRPFTGDVHLSAFYPDALGSDAIAVLFELGPEVPEPEAVPAPIADICPDPREIGRIDLDGRSARSGFDTGGGGADEVPACGLLRPHVWSLTAPLGAIISQAAEPPGDDCQKVLRVTYDESQQFELIAALTANQIPIRGHERSAVSVKSVSLPPLPPLVEFLRSDSNGDGKLDISDAVWSLSYLFVSGAPPACLDAADSNDDGLYDISDPIHTLAYHFLGGPAPPAPGPDCGTDPTTGGQDTLGCAAYGKCP